MRTETVHYVDDDYDVTLVVVQATMREAVKRATLRSTEEGVLKNASASSLDSYYEWWVRVIDYPCFVAATKEVINHASDDDIPEDLRKKPFALPVSGEEFLDLPEALVALWERAVWSLNPHWIPSMELDEKGKASEPRGNSHSTKGSSRGSGGKKEPRRPKKKQTTRGT
ncbi:MAG: hypothetical protein PHV11_07450 [Candidatus Bipolaricaulis sp.]|nr:hypothetical protein [Candidatus Bipolaricaulis sp.]